MNAIFGTAHSIRGGAAVFGFAAMAALTNGMETVFDRVRKEAAPSSLETDHRRVAGASGATMTGDGRVAPILDRLQRAA